MRFDHKMYEKLFPATEAPKKPEVETMVETVVVEQQEETNSDGDGSPNEPDPEL